MSSSNCCFLTCIQISQEVGQAIFYMGLIWQYSLESYSWKPNLFHSNFGEHKLPPALYELWELFLLLFSSGCSSYLSYFPHVFVSHSVVSTSVWPHGLYSPPGSSVHAILQARILEWVAMPSSRDLPDPEIEPKPHYASFTGRRETAPPGKPHKPSMWSLLK